MRIEIDEDGYPTESSLQAVRSWAGPVGDIPLLLDAVAEYFNDCGYGKARRRGNVWRLATGGWSGCEDVLEAVPVFVTALAWQSSHRGGLHWYALENLK